MKGITVRYSMKTLVFLKLPQYTIELLRKFQQVDDAYILDGLYSSLYGFVLMSDDKEIIGIIAKNIYKFVSISIKAT